MQMIRAITQLGETLPVGKNPHVEAATARRGGGGRGGRGTRMNTVHISAQLTNIVSNMVEI